MTSAPSLPKGLFPVFRGFKDFILRGNVIELAIAVVIGGAFTALVTAVTKNVVMPVVAATGGVDGIGLGFHVLPGNDNTFVDLGAVVTASVTFLITAGVVYFIFVLPMNKAHELIKHRVGAGAPEETPVPVDTALLTEMRDLLREMNERSLRP